MTNYISLLLIFCVFIACSHNSQSPTDKSLIVSRNTLQSNVPTKTDTSEIDAVKVSPDIFKVLLENEHVRVIEYSLKPGQKDNPHTHPPKTSYVISGGMLRIYPENEKPFDAEEVTGTSEWAGRRGKHYVENIGQTTITILVTEIKSAQ